MTTPTDTTEKEHKVQKEKARTIDLEKEETGAGGADATQPKSSAAAPSSRLKAPPKTSNEAAPSSTKSSGREASTIARVGSKRTDEGLTENVLTQVSQQKFEAQEEKLKDVARHAMSSLRDFHKLSESEYAKKVTEIRKALMKYEMQYVRVWELQDRNRQAEIEESQSSSERLHRDANAETTTIAQLKGQLEKEKMRKRRYEVHEATAAQINQKRTRVELQADIDGKTAEIEQLRNQNKDLKDQAKQVQQRGQLLREAAEDMKQLLASQMESAAATVPAGSAGAAVKASAPPLVEVIS